MKKARLKQYGLAIYLIVSLFVSAVSAGTCLHHPKRVEPTVETSCHRHAEKATEEISSGQHEKADTSETAQSFSPDGECRCIEPARKVVAKTENLKIEKQTLADVPAPQAAAVFISQKLTVKTDFSLSIYLTDSFYKLAFGRAPPIL